jgi:crotonobetainyl-CoA:carnitine CoA-transferase CaiB-like acyl-CoA transferase
MILNLREKEGKEIFYKLAIGADVILEGNRPGVVNRLGIDYETIKKMNPGIIYCSLSGFGQDGPYVDIPGFEPIYVSVGGPVSVVGDREGRPVIPLNFAGDMAGGGLHSALGIVMALYAREKTGKGQYIDLALTDGVVSVMAQALALYWYDGVKPERGNCFDTGGLPYYRLYETKDGKYITIAALLPLFYERLCKALGHEELIPHQAATGEKAEEIKKTFQSTFITKTQEEWFEILRKADVPVAKMNELEDLETNPYILHRKMITSIKDPVTGREEKAVGIAIKFSETPGSLRSLPPDPGQHTHQILKELGYTEEQIEELKKKKVCG